MEASWRVLGTSCGALGDVVSSRGRPGGVLGTFWGRIGLSWERLGAVLGAIWAVLASWKRLRAPWGLLGPSLSRLYWHKAFFKDMSFRKAFFIWILMDFASKYQAHKVKKTINSIGI